MGLDNMGMGIISSLQGPELGPLGRPTSPYTDSANFLMYLCYVQTFM
jgi:hypothetical protein